MSDLISFLQRLDAIIARDLGVNPNLQIAGILRQNQTEVALRNVYMELKRYFNE